jgi:hypothetical protein
MNQQTPFTKTGFTPSEEDIKSLMDWFAAYDASAEKNDVEAMSDKALFPITVITNDSHGNCITQEWDRTTFVQSMGMAMAGTNPAEIKMENHREPVFLNKDLAVVITNSTVTIGDQVQHLRYADVIVKMNGEWKFKSMIQAGWGDMLKQYMDA